jgi:hypothetical protein
VASLQAMLLPGAQLRGPLVPLESRRALGMTRTGMLCTLV